MSVQHHPRVTVLMTLYNKAPFVEEAIRSILEGTYADLEVLVVDDASTDEGPKVVQRISDPRIRLLVAERNGGRAAAANRGYQAARGEFIAVLDADDIAHPERLAKQVAFMDEHPEVGVLGTGARLFGQQEKTFHWPASDVECRAKMFFSDPVLYGSCIIRRSVLLSSAVRSDESWTLPGEDYLFLIGLSAFTQFANLPEVLLQYRIGEQNQRHGRDAYADRRAICARVFRSFDIPISDAELDLHLLFYLLHRDPVTARQVVAFRAWMARLAAMNKEQGLFPVLEFEQEMERRWRRLFYLLPGQGIQAALAHLRCSGQWPLARLVYLVKVTVRRWFGLTQAKA